MPSFPVQSAAQNDIRPTRDNLGAALRSRDAVNLVFPSNLEEIDHWMVFRANKKEFRKKDDFPLNNDLTRIFLPVPGSIGTQYTQDYNAEGIGALGVGGAGIAKSFIEGGSGVDAIVDKIQNTTTQDIMDYAAYEAARNPTAVGAAVGSKLGVGGALAGAAIGQGLKGGLAAAGVAVNPYLALLYNSPQLRSHAFSWKLVAKNEFEQNAIQEIITAFKHHGAPSLHEKNAHLFNYPEQFDIDFHYNDYLYNIGPSVLTSFEVAYHAEGQPLYHKIGNSKAPVSITINATFQEVAVVTKETIKENKR